MNMQDFAKQWEEAVEALETSETEESVELSLRSALVAGIFFSKSSYNCTQSWTPIAGCG